ncbi:hypothetical protein [Bradyrhizobium ottawaense]|uniref:Uncharacterized protein n=1 Tax=Bradyrhizobium ottawaense TaxID=931866 RepID=A0ABY0QHA8_9BRAD|nr:hypothetical protein [Bradyrhizobium ottawaense]SDK41888.1 hypothetical protein SAMN05444163_8065 [Bradyrhizobium ottawaense]
MPQAHIPAELTDLAMNALEDEVACWRRIPMYPGVIRLMRFPQLSEIDLSPAGAAISDDAETVCYHDVQAKQADDLVLRFAMEKVVEAILGAVSVGA